MMGMERPGAAGPARGAQLDAKNEDGFTPFGLAASAGVRDVAEVLWPATRSSRRRARTASPRCTSPPRTAIAACYTAPSRAVAARRPGCTIAGGSGAEVRTIAFEVAEIQW